MKPLIGIISKSYEDIEWSSVSYGQRSSYCDAVSAAGGIPVIVPLTSDIDVLRQTYDRLDGIVLAGGGDINPARYGEERYVRHDEIDRIMSIDDLRDTCEIALARWARADSRPIIGICRGMQIINIAFGGDLYQDLAHQTTSKTDHIASLKRKDWQHLAHTVRFEPTSIIGQAMGASALEVNSFHHQAVRQLGVGLKPVGWSEDGIIEALEGDDCWGVQYHPEVMTSVQVVQTGLFELLVEKSRTRPVAVL